MNDKWYGPIEDLDRAFYIKIKKVSHYEKAIQSQKMLNEDENEINTYNEKAEYSIRWTVIAEVTEKYISLSWNNFQYNSYDGLSESRGYASNL